jgi:UDP-N-acetylglucosamine 2-epimerase (non-hydrolysing)
VAAKMRIPVAHVEAGLRNGDMQMQEEINRILVDSISTKLYTTSQVAQDHLAREGRVMAHAPKLVGNVMVDTLLRFLPEAKKRYIRAGSYAVLTLHRAENVDDPDKLQHLINAVDEIAQQIPVIWPIHPRVRKNYGVSAWNIDVVPPMGYLQFISTLAGARLVLTDSGGVQEETTVLGVPCLTLRENTERPETVFQGTNYVVGTNPEVIVEAAETVLSRESIVDTKRPPLWDGHAAERILEDLCETL